MNSNIKVAMCFDNNIDKVTMVSIASLIDSRGSDHYDIYCVCTDIGQQSQEYITHIVKSRDLESNVYFKLPPEDFRDENNKKYEHRGINDNAYVWMFLHRVLEEDKVIYLDVDTLFLGSLVNLWNDDRILNNYVIGVKGASNFDFSMYKDTFQECEMEGLKGKYINSGVLLLNLKKIREWNPDDIWKDKAKKQYYFQDQDILNITCRDAMDYISPQYNMQAHLSRKWYNQYYKDGLYGKYECVEAWNNPIIIHYTGPKPWFNKGVRRGKLWWDYVDKNPDLAKLFDKKTVPNNAVYGVLGYINRHLKLELGIRY